MGAPGKVVRLAALHVVNRKHPRRWWGHGGEFEMAGVRPEARLRRGGCGDRVSFSKSPQSPYSCGLRRLFRSLAGKTEVAKLTAHIRQKTSRSAWSLQLSEAASPRGWYVA
jgi:hypothetical protein